MFINLIGWLVVSRLFGWVASGIMRTDRPQESFVVVGIVGAAVAALFLSPLIGVATINQGAFNLGAPLVSLVGAVLLLASVNPSRRVPAG